MQIKQISVDFLRECGWTPEGASLLMVKRHIPEIGAMLYRLVEKKIPHANYGSKTHIPSSLRWDVWERDDFTCQHCGIRKNLSIDHIVPESRGGTLVNDNLQTLCKSCNSKKGAE